MSQHNRAGQRWQKHFHINDCRCQLPVESLKKLQVRVLRNRVSAHIVAHTASAGLQVDSHLLDKGKLCQWRQDKAKVAAVAFFVWSFHHTCSLPPNRGTRLFLKYRHVPVQAGECAAVSEKLFSVRCSVLLEL